MHHRHSIYINKKLNDPSKKALISKYNSRFFLHLSIYVINTIVFQFHPVSSDSLTKYLFVSIITCILCSECKERYFGTFKVMRAIIGT